MDLSNLTGDERLIAEQAVLAYQAARQAGKDAPHGQGMELVEQTVRQRGFEVLRRMVELSVSEHAGAQKKGSAAKSVRAGTR